MLGFTINVPIRDVDSADVKNAFASTYGYRETIDLGNGILEPNPVSKEQFVTSCCTQFLLSILKAYTVESAEAQARNEAIAAASERAQENISLFDIARIESLPVNPFENFPTLTETTASITKGDVAEIQLLGIDPDNLPLTYEVINQPSNGTVLISGDELVYTPESSFHGQVIIGVKAFNGTKYSQITNIIVDVISHSPVVSDMTLSIEKDGTLVIDLSGSDPDNDSLTYAVESLPSYGTIFQNDSNTQTYVPNTGFVGQDELTYKAFDGTYYSDPATIIINVTGE
jgi:SepF-like predicted cell division protein (DUF552 family)